MSVREAGGRGTVERERKRELARRVGRQRGVAHGDEETGRTDVAEP